MRKYLVSITTKNGKKVSYEQAAKTAPNAILRIVKGFYVGARITAVSAEEFSK